MCAGVNFAALILQEDVEQIAKRLANSHRGILGTQI
jgi:hypothetical protein